MKSSTSFKKGNTINVGRKHSPEHRANLALSRKTRFAKYGRVRRRKPTHLCVTPVNLRIRSSPKYISWRKAIFKRDDYTCQFCGKRGRDIQVDHIISFSSIMQKLRFEHGVVDCFDVAMSYPLLWDTTNGRTLCIKCHKTTKSYSKHTVSLH